MPSHIFVSVSVYVLETLNNEVNYCYCLTTISEIIYQITFSHDTMLRYFSQLIMNEITGGGHSNILEHEITEHFTKV